MFYIFKLRQCHITLPSRVSLSSRVYYFQVTKGSSRLKKSCKLHQINKLPSCNFHTKWGHVGFSLKSRWAKRNASVGGEDEIGSQRGQSASSEGDEGCLGHLDSKLKKQMKIVEIVGRHHVVSQQVKL